VSNAILLFLPAAMHAFRGIYPVRVLVLAVNGCALTGSPVGAMLELL